MPREHIHFVTGRLAEHSLRRMVESLAGELGFRYSIDVLPITVAAFNFFAPDIAVNLFTTLPGQLAIVFAVVMVVVLNILGTYVARMPPLEL